MDFKNRKTKSINQQKQFANFFVPNKIESYFKLWEVINAKNRNIK